MTAVALAMFMAFAAGMYTGRSLPRRGRHARRLTRRGRDHLAELRKSQANHPAASGNVIIDLRAWVPTDDALVRRLAQTPASSIRIANPAQD